MYHLESSFTGKNAFWRYLIMLIAIFTATNTIGAIPLLIAMGLKTRVDPDIISILSENPNDLSPLGYDPNLNLLILLFPFIIGLLTFLLLIKPLNSRTLAVTINGTDSFRWRRFIVSAFVWISLSALYMFIVVKFDPSNFSLNNTSATLIPLIVISCLFVPVQASFEEIVFRGYLMQGFTVLLRNRIFPLIMTSLLFALMHSLNPEVGAFGFWTMMPQYILFGLIFGLITILDDGIEAAMGAHTANNAFLLVMNTNKSSALQTDALYEQINTYPWLEFGSLLVMGILTVIILKHIFKWKDFGVLLEKVGPDKDLAHMP